MANDFNGFTSYDAWQTACSQESGCLSCPLSIHITGKECYTLTAEEIRRYKDDSSREAEAYNGDKSF